jgi:serine protease Do
VLELNGQSVTGPEDLSVRISQMAPGAVAHLKTFREGQKRDVDATLGEAPEQTPASQKGAQIPSALAGTQVQDLTPEIARQLKLPPSQTGVVVTELDPSSAAAAAGIREGDVIQEVNRKPVRNVEQFRHALAATANQAVLLLVNRGGTTHFVVLER